MRNIVFAGLVLIVAGFAIYKGIQAKDKPLRKLAYFGNFEIKHADDGSITDTIHATIPDFSFTDQQGNTVTQANFEGKIYVIDYFYSTCEGICPKMTKQMDRVATHFKDDPEIKFISHTVNPEYDSVNVLADYAAANNARYGQWYFVTGDKKELYKLARENYMITASKGKGDEEDFIHSPNFVLIDKEKHIRGTYDGTVTEEINQLIHFLICLFQQHIVKGQHEKAHSHRQCG